MINKNMMEKSVISLKNHIPQFVRSTYSQFTDVFKETLDTVKEISTTSPYTANKLASEIVFGLPMLKVLKELKNDTQYNKILERLTGLNIRIDDEITADEDFSIINGTDIYAPVSRIEARITPFSAKKVYNVEWKKNVVPVVFEVCRSFKNIETLVPVGSGFKPIYADDIEGFQGQKTILDRLGTCVGIDISILFQRYLFDLVEEYPVTTKFDNAIEILDAAYNKINDEIASDEIEKYTKDLLAITISTYFVYASKLIGSKADIFSWAYTAFVKDSMDHFDKSQYPVNANITKASGHAVNGAGNAGDSGKYDENTMTANAQLNYESDEKPYKALIYRNIRLQYSTWATVINAIFTSAFRAKRMDEGSGIFTAEYERNICRGKGFDHMAASGTEYNKLCEFICEALLQYITVKYRTYNTPVQLCGTELNPEDSSQLIENVISNCRDEKAVAIAKESISGYKINQIYVPYNENVAGILTANESIKKALSKTFMDAAYLIILNYVHSSMSKVMEEIEPVTGKTNKALFEEIYYGVKRSLYNDIDEYSWGRYHDTTLNDMITAYTPYVVSDLEKCEEKSALQDIHHDNNIPQPVLTENENDPYRRFIPAICIVCIPFVSEYTKLKQIYDFSNFSEGSYVNTHNQTGSRFPKNKVIIEGLSKLGHELTLNRAFGSIESANECVKVIKERVEEGADCMANNACYSALGAIGGGITEIEIKNEADDNFISDSIAKLTDSEGNAIKQGTSDTEDLSNAVTHALESAAPNQLKCGKNVVESFNELFNNVILGI